MSPPFILLNEKFTSYIQHIPIGYFESSFIFNEEKKAER